MTIKSEQSLRNFEFWSGARTNARLLTYEELDRIEVELEYFYPDGMDETQVNDRFWFETDYIATLLGYRNWEHLEKGNDPIKIKCTNVEWDIDEDEEIPDDLPTSVEILLDDEDDIGDYLEAKESGDEDDFIANKLSDEYGYCVNSFEMEEDGE